MSDKNEIFNYVMNTPDNTNPAILRGMLNDLSDGGSPGYDVETITVNIIPEQTVTLESDGPNKSAALELADGVSMPWPDTLTVVFNGDEYELTGEEVYGSASAYEGPGGQFTVLLNGSGEPLYAMVLAPLDSPLETVTISATTTEKEVTVTDDFKEAVAVANGSAVGNFVINITYDGDTDTYMMDKTWAEIAAADEIPVAVIRDSASTFYYPVYGVERTELGYSVGIIKFENDMLDIVTYQANTPSDYPSKGGLA